jgi:hypothetical protein
VVKKDDPIELLSERLIGRELAGEIPERERDGDDGGGGAAIGEFYGKISVFDHNLSSGLDRIRIEPGHDQGSQRAGPTRL